jgi:hypothetical protein
LANPWPAQMKQVVLACFFSCKFSLKLNEAHWHLLHRLTAFN